MASSWTRGGVDDHDVLLGGRPQGDRGGGEVLRRPVPAPVVALVDVAVLGKEGEEVVGGPRAEGVAGGERKLERGRLEVGQQDVEVVRVDPGLLGGLVEDELRVVHDVLVDRGGRGDEHRHARPIAAAGTPDLLPGGRDRTGVAGEDRRVEAADVDPELEGVRGDDAEDLAVAKALLDRAPLRG
jgi:hypothetical protein